MPDVFQQRDVKHARKTYHCCECGETIKIGQPYRCDSGIWDGDWRIYRTCVPCARMRDDLCYCGYIYGELGEAITNCFGFSPYEVPEEE